MRIGVDARPLASPKTGIGHYLTGLLGALAELDARHEFVLYAHRAIEFAPLPRGWRIHTHRGIKGTGPIWLQLYGTRLAVRDGIDLFWGAHFFLPLRLPRHIPAIVTVYDLVPFLYPQTMEIRNYLVTRLLLPPTLARAQQIMVISQSVAVDLQRLFSIPADRMSVVPPGVRPQFHPRDPAEAARRVAGLGIDRPYVLTVGTVEPRKNLRTLLRAWNAVPREDRDGVVLVVAGARGWRSSSLYAEAGPLIEAGVVRFLGYVADSELPWLYAGARAFVFSSLYEGFGMPVTEAMACDVPVIGSDIPVVREVAGDAAVYVGPTDVPGWTTAMAQVLTDAGSLPRNRTLGRQRAAQYTFERSAALLLSVLEDLRVGSGVHAEISHSSR